MTLFNTDNATTHSRYACYPSTHYYLQRQFTVARFHPRMGTTGMMIIMRLPSSCTPFYKKTPS